jgi:hypothetical protein
MIAGFLVGVWIARYLGPEKYGLFSYALAFVSLFAGVAKLGLDGIVVRELVKEPEKKELYLGTAFWLKLRREIYKEIQFYKILLFFRIQKTSVFCLWDVIQLFKCRCSHCIELIQLWRHKP